jgi:hypothetical protein
MTWFQNFFGPSKNAQIDLLKEQVKDLARDLREKQEEFNDYRVESAVAEAKVRDELAVLQKAEDEREAKKTSNTPWVEISSTEFDPNRGIKMSVDWNDAFIAHCKGCDIRGTTDDEIGRKWLAWVAAEMAGSMELEEIENSDRGDGTSEFQ